MITFQIYLAAKSVKEALKMREELLAGGVKEDSISFPPPSVARCASPSLRASSVKTTPASNFTLPSGKMNQWQLENHWSKATGSNFKATQSMVEKFALPDDRGGRIAKLCTLLASGEVVRTENPVQYLLASELRGSGSEESYTPPADMPDEIDLDCPE